MALLNPDRRGLPTALVVTSAAALAGCFLVEIVAPREERLEFSHRLHVQEQGLDCSDCHGGVEDSDEPGMPVLAQCALCHEDLDADKPPEKQVASLFAGGQYAAARVSALSSEVIFSHLAHVGTSYGCSACHGALEESDRIGPEVAVPMDECGACHREAGAPEECATCHREIRADRPPRSHDQEWMAIHGSIVRGGSDDAVDRCDLCHKESSCTICHQIEPPRDHTNYWRRRGHSLSAAFDRDRCAACHEPDSCNRCHEQALPITHVGTWGGTLSTHCFSCHFPLRAEGCFTCHKDADSHSRAPPKPPDHFPGMDCRQCHGLTAPLPHADNGSDCNICHP